MRSFVVRFVDHLTHDEVRVRVSVSVRVKVRVRFSFRVSVRVSVSVRVNCPYSILKKVGIISPCRRQWRQQTEPGVVLEGKHSLNK